MREGSECQEHAKPGEVLRRVLVAVLIGCWVAASPSGLAQTDSDVPEPITSPSSASESPASETANEPAPISEAASSPEQPIDDTSTSNSAPGGSEQLNEYYPWTLFSDGGAQWVMVALTGLALILSGIAVYLLRETLCATRDTLKLAEDANEAARAAVEATKETGRAQVRAYVEITEAELSLVEDTDPDGEERVAPKIDIKFENVGNTVAKSFDLRGNIGIQGVSGGMTKNPLKLVPTQVIIRPNQVERDFLVLHYARLSDAELAYLSGKRVVADIVIEYWYLDIFGERITEERAFRATIKDGKINEKWILRPNIFPPQMLRSFHKLNQKEPQR
tara:strand:+ start:37275 stop:38276 length:1002 start_codon:yes stop_codon:yes gene_type:complete